MLLSSISHAQDYRCIIPGEKAYFTNADQYLRGIRIDSTHTYPDSTIYYPFHSQRGPYLGAASGIFPTETNGGCWIGKTVRRYSDGVYAFENIWRDSVTVKTQVNIGDSWILYSDTSHIYYKATVVTKAPEDVLGISDTVIRLQIQTFHSDTGYIPSDPANALTIAISKNFGLVEAFDFYLFPHRLVADHLGAATSSQVNDYYFQVCGDQQFRLTGFVDATVQDIYDFVPGNIFAYSGTRNTYGSGTTYRRVDTIVGKITTGSGSVNYNFHRREIWEPPSPGSNLYSFIQLTMTIDVDHVFDTSLMPEETGIAELRYYKPVDSSYCAVAALYGRKWPILAYGLGVCPVEEWLKPGLGTTFSTQCTNPDYLLYDETALQYVKKGAECGIFDPIPNQLNSRHPNSSDNWSISPNPTKDYLQLTSHSRENINFQLMDLFGNTIISGNGISPIRLDIFNVVSGTYIVIVHDSNERATRKVISVLH
ncbi:MAG: T9SS type A sorting domain-containing protein [Taibaiella sp.]|nr:T9SS type A sorting domain-containing protein [Taibaiella sp.]